MTDLEAGSSHGSGNAVKSPDGGRVASPNQSRHQPGPGKAAIALLNNGCKEVYLLLYLRIPVVYYGRIFGIFNDDRTGSSSSRDTSSTSTPRDDKTQNTARDVWERFMDNLTHDWSILNVVSGLIISTILSVFQIEDTDMGHPTRMAAYISLVCAILSLCLGALFSFHFGPTRAFHERHGWVTGALEANNWLWNPWTLLALPMVWLAWSICSLIVVVICFVWRKSPSIDTPTAQASFVQATVLPNTPSFREPWGVRLAVLFLFSAGLAHITMAVYTLTNPLDGTPSSRRTKGSDEVSLSSGNQGPPPNTNNSSSSPTSPGKPPTPNQEPRALPEMQGSTEKSMPVPSVAIPTYPAPSIEVPQSSSFSSAIHPSGAATSSPDQSPTARGPSPLGPPREPSVVPPSHNGQRETVSYSLSTRPQSTSAWHTRTESTTRTSKHVS